MTVRTEPPFRAHHVGSLPRPPKLMTARQEHAAGQLSDVELRAAEDEAIVDVVAMQEEVGLRSATDGEFRRASWHMDFIYQLRGITQARERMQVKFHNAAGDIEFAPAALKVTEPIRLDKTIFGDAFQYL